MKTINVNGTDLPVAYDVDILVVGGGPAGVGAGIAAAREGKRVLIIEQFNCLGGVATAGGHGHYSIFCEWAGQRRIVGGHRDPPLHELISFSVGTATRSVAEGRSNSCETPSVVFVRAGGQHVFVGAGLRARPSSPFRLECQKAPYRSYSSSCARALQRGRRRSQGAPRPRAVLRAGGGTVPSRREAPFRRGRRRRSPGPRRARPRTCDT